MDKASVLDRGEMLTLAHPPDPLGTAVVISIDGELPPAQHFDATAIDAGCVPAGRAPFDAQRERTAWPKTSGYTSEMNVVGAVAMTVLTGFTLAGIDPI